MPEEPDEIHENGRGEKDSLPQVPTWVGIESLAAYADIIRVQSNERQFFITFAQARPEGPSFQVATQVYLNPQTAGELFAILGQQLIEHQENYGTKLIPENIRVTKRKKRDVPE